VTRLHDFLSAAVPRRAAWTRTSASFSIACACSAREREAGMEPLLMADGDRIRYRKYSEGQSYERRQA